LQKNGTTFAIGPSISTTQSTVVGTTYAEAGDVLRIVRSGGGTVTLTGAIENNFLEIERLSDYSVNSSLLFGMATSAQAGLVTREVTGTGTITNADGFTASKTLNYAYSRVGKSVTF